MKKQILEKAYMGIGLSRSINFTVQGILLPLVDQIVGNRKDRTVKLFAEHLKSVSPKVQKLLFTDARNMALGHYPPQVLFNESPLAHYSRVPLLILDAVRANLQRKNKNSNLFENDAQDFLNELPEYYRRNFHFQKSGYLADESARLYEHQVEILFSGTAQAMRRQMIPVLKNHFTSSDGAGLKFLEVGSGTGALTRAMAYAFPKAQITCVDLSPHYLKYAQSKLKDFRRIDYIQGKGEELSFKDETFDAVFSCYLFHELPEKIRMEVLKEKFRTLKHNGIMILADSIQKRDDPDLDWALSQFPIDFHEPFFKNYIEKNLENIISKELKYYVESEIHFLTKIIWAKKDK
jgi:ubiquinone/menaquinone biosynthesis C-methylase UbiE